jgi:hypothetical protein
MNRASDVMMNVHVAFERVRFTRFVSFQVS